MCFFSVCEMEVEDSMLQSLLRVTNLNDTILNGWGQKEHILHISHKLPLPTARGSANKKNKAVQIMTANALLPGQSSG